MQLLTLTLQHLLKSAAWTHHFPPDNKNNRRRHGMQKQSISAIAREMSLSRPTVRKHLNTVVEPKYERDQPPSPKLGEFEAVLTQWLETEAKLARPRRRSAYRLFEPRNGS